MTSPSIIDRTARVLVVTGGLSVAGGLVGAICGAATIIAIAAIEGGLGGLVSHGFLNILGLCAGFGAIVGMIGAPTVGWGLLRRVPLGRAIAFTAAGSVVGAVVGELARGLTRDIPTVFVGAFVGFIVAAMLVRPRVDVDSAF